VTRRVKGWLLLGMLVVWAGLLGIRFSSQDEPLHTPLTYRSGQALVKARTQPTAGLPALAKAAPSRESALTLHPPKNIFAPLGRQLEVAEARAREGGDPQDGVKGHEGAPPPMSPEEAAIAQARALRDQAAQQARQRMAQYRFIGYLSQNGEPRAFLGKGPDLYIVRAGEMIEGQIHVATIGATWLTLRDVASDMESALPLAREGGSARPGDMGVPGFPMPEEPPHP